MATDAVLNIRLPKELKEHGNQVLKKNNRSVSAVVRDLYEYMEREQKIPDCLMKQEEEPVSMRRRRLLREVAGSVTFPSDFDYDEARAEYLDKKYGEAL